MEINSDLVEQLETLTRSGKTQKVAEIVDRLVLSRAPRALAARLAQLCFRNSLYLQSLRVLSPIVRSETPVNPPPQPTEMIAYASALVSLNMPREARSYLRRVNKVENPEALLIESFSYFGEWNYAKSIPLLKKFIANPRVSLYRQVVGKVNLAAAFVTSAHQVQAELLLKELLALTTERGLRLLKGNTLELLAQVEIQKKNYEQALFYLQEAKQEFPDTNSIYFFFVKKWESICKMLLNPGDQSSIAACEELKTEAKQWRHWETARDVDLYIAFATKDEELLQKLIAGTANPNFIKKIELLYGHKIMPAKKVSLQASGAKAPVENSLSYTEITKSLKLKSSGQKLFSLLTRDFYRPANLGYLFSQLFPKEYFNPLTSEKRILNQVYALRDELNSKFEFLSLRKDKMDFIFELHPGAELIFHRHAHRLRHTPSLKESLRGLGAKPFSSEQLATYLACSKRKAQMLIRQLLSENFLVAHNGGPQIQYLLRCYSSQRISS